MTAFALHPRLAADASFVIDLALSRVLLMNDSRYPWVILVPRRDGAVELHDLAQPDRGLLIEEIAHASAVLKMHTGSVKMNIGALGNTVPQLHVHVVARSIGDAAWPGPVWGKGEPLAYAPSVRDVLIGRLAELLARPLP
jgi:diadenosine tetraphosphate (Ap4A) HIT family hydrolase